MIKYFEKRKLVKFRNHLKNNSFYFPVGYLKYHQKRIEWLDYLIASYEGRAGSPKLMLETLISSNLEIYTEYVLAMKDSNVVPMTEVEMLRDVIKQIDFYYQWVYYKNITGF